MEQKSGQAIVFALLAMLMACGQVNQADVAQAAGWDLQIAVDHEQLSLRLQDASLVEVVERVAQTLFLTSHVAPGLETMLVTLTVKDVPFRQGLAQLLANTNYVLTNRDLYVWPRGEFSQNGEWRERKHQAPPDEPVEQPEISEEELKHQAIYGDDPETRTTALELLSDEGIEKAMSTLVEALKDQSPEVRGMALELLGESEGPIPIDQISKIVSSDPNPEQRMEAIVVLASRDEETAQAVLQQALQDSDPEVVELAKSILQDIEADFDDDDPR